MDGTNQKEAPTRSIFVNCKLLLRHEPHQNYETNFRTNSNS